MKKNRILVVLCCCFWSFLAVAQQEKESVIALSHSEFLDKVGTHNLEYAVEKYKLPRAAVALKAARMVADPVLSTQWVDNGDKHEKSGYGFEAALEWEVSLAGKRKARTHLAKREQALAAYEVQAFFEGLRAEATLNYAEAIKNKMIEAIQQQSYETMLQLSKSDSLRYTLGQISRVESIQSVLEAKSMKHEWQNATTEWRNSLEELKVLLGDSERGAVYVPTGRLNTISRLFEIETLLEEAPYLRADYLAVKQQQLVAAAGVKAAKAARAIDLGLSVGVESDAFFNHVVVPRPTGTLVTFGLAIPLKFSNAKNPEWRLAKLDEEQANMEQQVALQELNKEISQAFRHYSIKLEQKESFETEMLQQAKEVLEGRMYSYKRGSSSLLELLEAQRVYNETQQNYVETLFECTTALVALERAAGIWDVEL